MKFVARVFVLLALALAIRQPLRAQSQSPAQPAQAAPVYQGPYYQLSYATSDIQIYEVVIPSGQSAPLYPQDDDYLFIALTNSNVTINQPGQAPIQDAVSAGDVRFAEGGSGSTLTNDGGQPFLALSIEFLNSGLAGRGCSCAGGPANSICGCPNSSPLPPDWSLQIGHVFLRGVTLAPGATFDDDSPKPTRLIVPVTPLDVLDTTIHEPRNLQVRLPVGSFHWLGAGPHQIQNLASSPLRFVYVQF